MESEREQSLNYLVDRNKVGSSSRLPLLARRFFEGNRRASRDDHPFPSFRGRLLSYDLTWSLKRNKLALEDMSSCQGQIKSRSFSNHRTYVSVLLRVYISLRLAQNVLSNTFVWIQWPDRPRPTGTVKAASSIFARASLTNSITT
jgi:hypothetical protein